MNARILGVLALSSWAMLEGGFVGYHFYAVDHHGERDQSTGVGLGLGFRVAPSPRWLRGAGPERPRGEHLHPGGRNARLRAVAWAP